MIMRIALIMMIIMVVAFALMMMMMMMKILIRVVDLATEEMCFKLHEMRMAGMMIMTIIIIMVLKVG